MSAQMLLLAILSVFSATVAGFLSPRATCASLGAGWTDVASAFTLAAYSSATDTSTPLYIVNVNVVPHTAYHVISVRRGHTLCCVLCTKRTLCLAMEQQNLR